MPAITECHFPGCKFHGNHGFDSTVGNLMFFYHTTPEKESHVWYVGTLPNGEKFYSADKSEAFEKCVVPLVTAEANDPNLTSLWIAAWRARLAGNETEAEALFDKWAKAFS